jgi:Zn-dependent peptidase ImmA (M78 family)
VILHSAAPARILDDALREVVRNEAHGAEFPLAVRRFCEKQGTLRPTHAMQLATQQLLSEYFDRRPSEHLPLSVERLCDICNVQLDGIKPSGRNGTAYAVHDDSRRSGHTGKTYFTEARPQIKIPAQVDFSTARLSVAHELGHVLIHSRDAGYDEATIRLPSSPEEECLAEYAARLLLMPGKLWADRPDSNLAESSVSRSSTARVTVHASILRLGDPDVDDLRVKGAILWRLNAQVPNSEPIHERLTPQWHLCPAAFVPIKKCRARRGSLIAQVADQPGAAASTKWEEVKIGTFSGWFLVHVFSWGSIADGTRLVLSVFQSPDTD